MCGKNLPEYFLSVIKGKLQAKLQAKLLQLLCRKLKKILICLYKIKEMCFMTYGLLA